MLSKQALVTELSWFICKWVRHFLVVGKPMSIRLIEQYICILFLIWKDALEANLFVGVNTVVEMLWM